MFSVSYLRSILNSLYVYLLGILLNDQNACAKFTHVHKETSRFFESIQNERIVQKDYNNNKLMDVNY